jgi:hypothetical protein
MVTLRGLQADCQQKQKRVDDPQACTASELILAFLWYEFVKHVKPWGALGIAWNSHARLAR